MRRVAVHVGGNEAVDVVACLCVLDAELNARGTVHLLPVVAAVGGDEPLVGDLPETAGDVSLQGEAFPLADREMLVRARVEGVVDLPKRQLGRAMGVGICGCRRAWRSSRGEGDGCRQGGGQSPPECDVHR